MTKSNSHGKKAHMLSIGYKLNILRQKMQNHNDIKVMILGLGSVGTYLLDYLISNMNDSFDIVVVGRNREKIEESVNIVRISSLIRENNKSTITIEAGIDFNSIAVLSDVMKKHRPDIIVNSSRAYPGLKYGSISWPNVRAYGIWSPLAIRLTKNIMEACERSETESIVINTSYSDAVIPWLKSAGKMYPDFGSGNLNHLVPRIRYAVADILGVTDYWNVSISFAAGHFHDVCISKEGQTEGVRLPLKIYYNGSEKVIDQEQIFRLCKIPMPIDSKRNMMNASSNYRIIAAIKSAIREGSNQRVFIPGAFGNLGGYPVVIGDKNGMLDCWIDETAFSFEEMNEANRQSMYLDGIEDIKEGVLYYTDELIEKADRAFGKRLPKRVSFDEIESVAEYIIDEIIKPQFGGGIKKHRIAVPMIVHNSGADMIQSYKGGVSHAA